MNPDLDHADVILIERLQRCARKLEAAGDAGDEEAREEAYAVRWAIISVNGISERAFTRLMKRYEEDHRD